MEGQAETSVGGVLWTDPRIQTDTPERSHDDDRNSNQKRGEGSGGKSWWTARNQVPNTLPYAHPWAASTA